MSFKKRHKINQLMRQVGRDLDGRCTDELHQELLEIKKNKNVRKKKSGRSVDKKGYVTSTYHNNKENVQ